MTPGGLITQFAPQTGLVDLVSGPDGAFWSVGYYSLVRMTTNGVISNFPYPKGLYLTLIASGPDGNLWFAANEQIGDTSMYRTTIGRVTTSGVFTTLPDALPSGAGIGEIAVGQDGNLWFTDCSLDRIGRITPSGIVTEFSAGMTAKSCPRNIVAGPDGNLWFTEASLSSYLGTPPPYTPGGIANRNVIGRITPAGVITEFGEETPYSAGLTAITLGPDGNLWFTEGSGNRVGRITPTGVITEFKLTGLADYAGLSSITTGPDKKLWFTEKNANKIGSFTPP